jgi:HSP20 family molecular chaperone IbpA
MKPGHEDKDEAFNPTVHRNDDDQTIHVIIPLDGIAEEQIRIDLERTTLTLFIAKEQRVIKKAIRVPGGMRFFKKVYHDGILEIFLKKAAP